MKFWDASAVVPLLVAEPASGSMLRLLKVDRAMTTWWATPLECVSALCRREREDALDPAAMAQALGRLEHLRRAWHEIEPSRVLRTVAERLLRTHAIRAADALQLAAATVAARHEPPRLSFVCLDERLAVAAAREGFSIISS